jgi:hypothetical protein
MITFTEPAELQDLRRQIADMKAALAGIDNAPASDADALERVAAIVDQHAARGQADRLLAHALAVGTPTTMSWGWDHNGQSLQPSAFDLLCALDPERMRLALTTLVTDSKHPRGLPAAERSKRLVKLRADLRKAEVAEEAFITAAERAGAHIHRRPDVDPAIVIGA